MTPVTVEIFTSSLCANCNKVRSMVNSEIARLGTEKYNVRFVDVLEHIDHAVALGVLSTPAIAVGGELVITGLPTAGALRKVLDGHTNEDS